MKILSRFLCNKTTGPPTSHAIREISDGETATSSESEAAGGSDVAETDDPAEGEIERAIMEKPPSDDVCPICFENFDVPCRATCGHWYCGSCILQYWNYSATLKPCKCPMCSQFINKLMPESSLYQRHEAEISKILQNVGDYNRLFKGGISGLVLRFLATPFYMKRMLYELLNPDRPGAYLHQLRVIAMLLGILYSFSPIDFLLIGRRNIVDVFDYSAFALSFVLYLVGLCLRRRRQRNVRELADLQMDIQAADN